MDDEELRKRLIQFGINPGPITGTTRRLYLKKLETMEKKGDVPASGRSTRSNNEPNRRSSSIRESRSISTRANVNGFPAPATSTNKRQTDRVENEVPSPIDRVGRSISWQVQTPPAGRPLESDKDCVDSGSGVLTSTPLTGCDRHIVDSAALSRRYPHLSRRSHLHTDSDDDLQDWMTSPSTQLDRYRSRMTSARRQSSLSVPNSAWSPRSLGAGMVPLLLVLIAAVFFSMLAASYLQLHLPTFSFQTAPVPDPSSLEVRETTGGESGEFAVFPICGGDAVNVRLGCVQEEHMARAVALLSPVHSALYTLAHDVACGTSTHTTSRLSLHQLMSLLSEQGHSAALDLGALRDLAVLVAYNSHWGLSTDMGVELESGDQPAHLWPAQFTTSWRCLLVSSCSWLFRRLLYCGATLLVAACCYSCVQLLSHRRRRHQQAVLGMAERIVQLVAAGSPPGDPLAVSHVRDQLVPLSLRSDAGQLRVWRDAVELVRQTESRIREEQSLVHGEMHVVWRWLPSAVKSSVVGGYDSDGDRHVRRVWSDRAFTAGEGVNVPSHARTECLKVRNMFDCRQVSESGRADDWQQDVTDALLEKCSGARVLHLSVDSRSGDGLVYALCASREDALRAFRCLQGCWYDGRLVSVKFITLERYIQRFGSDSAQRRVPLRPSNSLRRSMVYIDAGGGDAND